MTRDDGGHAFPATYYWNDSEGGYRPSSKGGMTLRDYFAAEALQQAIQHELSIRASMFSPGDFRFVEVARAAYAMADAMLKERSRL